MSRERHQEIDVIKGMLTRYTRYDNMLLTCDDAAEGQHKLSLLTSLLWHTAIRVGGEIALQRARHQLKKLTHLGLTGKEKYRSLCIRLLREGGQVDITIMTVMCMEWCLMYSVYMLFTLDVTRCSGVYGLYCGRSLGTRLLYTQCHREVKGYKHFIVWLTHSTEDGVYAVLVSGDPPQQCAAGSPHGEAVLCLLGELLGKLIHLTLRNRTVIPSS